MLYILAQADACAISSVKLLAQTSAILAQADVCAISSTTILAQAFACALQY